MNYLTLALRLIHIFAGVFWVGGALMMNFFIAPTIEATAEAGQQFARHFIGKARVGTAMLVAGFSSVTAGAILYWFDSDGFTSPWMKSGAGIGFTIGAVFALIGLVFGIMIYRNTTALGKLGAQIQGKPTPEQLARLQAIQKQQAMISPLNAYSLTLAVVFMAVARYLVF